MFLDYVIVEPYNQAYIAIQQEECLDILSSPDPKTPTLFVISCDLMKKYQDCHDVIFYKIPKFCSSLNDLRYMYYNDLLEMEKLEIINGIFY